MKRLLFASIVGALVAGPALHAQRAAAAASPKPATRAAEGAALDRAVVAHGKLTSLRAAFTQTITNPLTGSKLDARGELFQKKPNFLLVEYSQPKNDRVVLDGRNLWVYLPSSAPGQVIRLDAPRGGGAGNFDVIGTFLDAPRERFTVADAGTATVEGRATTAVTLVPKHGAASVGFSKATVWVDDATGYVRRFETTEGGGIVRRVTITSISPNARVADTKFRFDVPKGVRVVEAPGAR